MSAQDDRPRPRPAWPYRLARALLAAAVGRLPEARRPWGTAMLSELDQARTAVEAMAWALGGVRVAWLERRRRPPREAPRGAWPVAAAGLGVAAGAGCLLRAVPLLGAQVPAGDRWWALGWALVLVAAGLAGLAAPVLVRRAPGWAAPVLGVAGLVAVMLGSLGLLPGLGLLAAAAIVAGAGAAGARRVPAAGPGPAPSVPGHPEAARVAVGVGLLGQVLAGPLLLAMAGLVAAPWALAALGGLWGGLLVVALRARRARPWLVLGVPVLTILVGLAVVSLGTAVLGWLP
jgi:hypothetical protein